ncbi:hypothetical protein [Sphingopyxis sp. KK2]|uniref:hypothetical protein n=1 Tax=Sphingopyxis sp. KK2 TaxID=1855727 RepID=UPI001C4E0142|nr:hypothetical protein [Sphingopyxis sp. KK2]
MGFKTGMMAAAMLALAGCGQADDGAAAPDKAALPDGPKAEIATIDAANLPEGVRAVVLAAVPDIEISGAQRKARDGMVFYDVEGSRGDGSEVELDVIDEGGIYRVVEIQRDIAWSEAPAAVRAAADVAPDRFVPARVIESTQTDGSVIYELFTVDKPDEPTAEIDWKNGDAKLRTERNAY